MKSIDEAWAGLTDGQKKALVSKLVRARTGNEMYAEELFRAVLSDDLRIIFVEGIAKLVDSTGRCISQKGMTEEVRNANFDFGLVKRETDFVASLDRLRLSFTPGMAFVSVDEYKRQFEALVAQIRAEKRVANLLKGVYQPLCLPQLKITDYGLALEETFLQAVQRSYLAAFPSRNFNNYR